VRCGGGVRRCGCHAQHEAPAAAWASSCRGCRARRRRGWTCPDCCSAPPTWTAVSGSTTPRMSTDRYSENGGSGGRSGGPASTSSGSASSPSASLLPSSSLLPLLPCAVAALPPPRPASSARWIASMASSRLWVGLCGGDERRRESTLAGALPLWRRRRKSRGALRGPGGSEQPPGPRRQRGPAAAHPKLSPQSPRPARRSAAHCFA
jgi:hypothetical protein